MKQIWIVPAVVLFCCACASGPGEPWARHTIDDISQGADGVRLFDVNGDTRPDVATGWEEGGMIRAYINPGPERAKKKWPSVTVGRVGDPEDAVFVDIDLDGVTDVVSSCEGNTKCIYFHLAPNDKRRYLDPKAWKTEALYPSDKQQQWMFCAPLQVDGERGVDLVAGSKNKNASVGWFESPRDPRRTQDWKWHRIYDAGWIMSIIPSDMDGDGDFDVVVSDRHGNPPGCLWLENPGPGFAQTRAWKVHRIGDKGTVMFCTLADLDGDGMEDVIAAVKERDIVFHRRLNKYGDAWKSCTIPMPKEAGTAKGIAVGDIDLDGEPDIVFTCEHADGDRPGVMWLSRSGAVTDPRWEPHHISGPQGVKFDRVELIDLDADGDLDVMTCEERENLGVFWYENPTR